MNTSPVNLVVASADRDGLDGQVGQHFGRCPAYTVVEVADASIVSARVVDNPFFQGHEPGDVPAFIAGLGADVLLAGGIGCRAIEFFDHYGVRVSSGHSGTTREAVVGWLGGAAGGAEPCVHEDDASGHGHHGGGCGGHA